MTKSHPLRHWRSAKFALVAQWIEQIRPKDKMGVQFPSRAPAGVCLAGTSAIGSALRSGRRGSRFKSGVPDHKNVKI